MTQDPTASETSLENIGLSPYIVTALTNTGISTVQDLLDRLDQGEKIQGIADKSLEEIYSRLSERGFRRASGPESEVEEDRQAESATERGNTETIEPPTPAKKASEAVAENPGAPSSGAEGEETERRIAFVGRLIVNERGKLQRIEVESETVKRRLDGLDVQGLEDFINEQISLSTAPEPAAAPASLPKQAKALLLERFGSETGLSVSDVQVLRSEPPGIKSLAFRSDEDLVVQVRFRLHGPQASSLASQEPVFHIQVYAHPVAGGAPIALASYQGNLAEETKAYTIRMPVSGTSPGLYRLRTLVTIREPVKILAYDETPMIQVTGLQPSTNSDISVVICSPQ